MPRPRRARSDPEVVALRAQAIASGGDGSRRPDGERGEDRAAHRERDDTERERRDDSSRAWPGRPGWPRRELLADVYVGETTELPLPRRESRDVLAESKGFEPLVAFTTPDFESGTFGHSVSSPPRKFVHRRPRVKRGCRGRGDARATRRIRASWARQAGPACRRDGRHGACRRPRGSRDHRSDPRRRG